MWEEHEENVSQNILLLYWYLIILFIRDNGKWA